MHKPNMLPVVGFLLFLIGLLIDLSMIVLFYIYILLWCIVLPVLLLKLQAPFVVIFILPFRKSSSAACLYSLLKIRNDFDAFGK